MIDYLNILVYVRVAIYIRYNLKAILSCMAFAKGMSSAKTNASGFWFIPTTSDGAVLDRPFYSLFFSSSDLRSKDRCLRKDTPRLYLVGLFSITILKGLRWLTQPLYLFHTFTKSSPISLQRSCSLYGQQAWETDTMSLKNIKHSVSVLDAMVGWTRDRPNFAERLPTVQSSEK